MAAERIEVAGPWPCVSGRPPRRRCKAMSFDGRAASSSRIISSLIVIGVCLLMTKFLANCQEDPATIMMANSSPDDNQEDLNSFNMMNAAQDKLLAVRNLLDARRREQYTLSSGNHQPPQQQDNNNNNHHPLRCTHKGRQFEDGQMVHIEEQPCLNCTCKLAVLQCYLRVCPPLVSLEAHKKRMLAAEGRALASTAETTCRMVKEAGQCCPTLKCSGGEQSSDSNRQRAPPAVAQEQDAHQQSIQRQHQAMMVQHHQRQQSSSTLNESLATDASDQQQQQQERSSGGGMDPLVASPSTIVQTTTSSTTTLVPHDNLPKLTVINGPVGQRDSILLITSNPQSIHTTAGQRLRVGANSSLTGGDQDDQRLVSSAPIIEALLESIYSSAANQLAGLNLQGSCMINGSLYFEGSAVLPESGASQCQYCYCIRQKVMCVKPRCHLIISGCTPKYNTEFACCPTSYQCQTDGGPHAALSSRGQLQLQRLQLASGGGSSPARLTTPPNEGSHASNSALQARLSAAIESILANRPSGPIGDSSRSTANFDKDALDPNEPLTPRQIDGASMPIAVNQPQHQQRAKDSTLMSLLNSILNASDENAPTSNATSAAREQPALSTTTSAPTTTRTTTTTETSATTTTTPAPTTTRAQELKETREEEPSSGDEDKDNGGGGGGSESDDNDHEEQNPPAGTAKSNGTAAATTTTSEPSQATTTTPSSRTTTTSATKRPNAPLPNGAEQTRSSVSDFLEPMNNLGPHMNTPTTPSGCTENGRGYAIGEQIPTLESCKHCYCGPEGLKECKMVECNLKGDHNCRPITPEGHCCPIRFECPPVASTKPDTPPPESPDSLLFRDVSQCKSSTGLENDCTAPAPVHKSTRLVDHADNSSSPRSSGQQPTSVDTPSQQSENGSLSSLTDELNQFIMRIRPNQSLTTLTDGPNLTLNDQFVSTATPVPPSINTINDEQGVSAGAENNTTLGGNAFIGRHDYESVRAQPAAAVIPPGMIGIPSIEPETIGHLARTLNNNIEPTVNPFESPSSAPPPSGGGGGQQQHLSPGGQRDMRSTNAHMFAGRDNINNLGDFNPTSEPILSTFGPTYEFGSSPSRAPFNTTTTTTTTNANGISLDDYIDVVTDGEPPSSRQVVAGTPALRLSNQILNSQINASEVPHIRSLRANQQHQNQRAHNSSNMVDFDDDAILGHMINNNHQNHTGGGFVHGRGPAASVSGFTPGEDDSSETATQPPSGHPTTGTPIGLDAERGTLSPETTSWLRLLPQWTRSFGQRLSGYDAFQGAADGQQPVLTLVAQNASSPGETTVGAVPPLATTGRSSRQQSPFMSMLKSIIATTAAQSEQQHESRGREEGGGHLTGEERQQRANLVMRPLESTVMHSNAGAQPTTATTTTSGNGEFSVHEHQRQQQPRMRSLSSPYEPPVSSSELEIVTAPVPLEPEVFGQTRAPDHAHPDQSNKELVVVATSSFARRSDVDTDSDNPDTPTPVDKPDEGGVRYFSSLASTGLRNQEDLPAPPPLHAIHKIVATGGGVGSSSSQPAPQAARLACYDALTNRTYQLNERIPKPDEPCKACHCILGKEICQPLVCPEKPGENCQEERRPGECCANFLCGDSFKASTQMPPVATQPVEQSQQQPVAQQQRGVASGSRNQAPTQRALSIDSTLIGRFNPNQVNQPTSRLTGPQQQQPAPTMRIGDLASILPPHLRFRSHAVSLGNNQQSPFQTGGPQMTVDQFRAQQANRLLFPQTQHQQQLQQALQRQFFNQVQSNRQQAALSASSQQTAQARVGGGNQQQHHQLLLTNNNKLIPASNSLGIGPPVLMHPQQFHHHHQQLHQQQQNAARRNDDPAPSVSFPGATGAHSNGGLPMSAPSTRPVADQVRFAMMPQPVVGIVNQAQSVPQTSTVQPHRSLLPQQQASPLSSTNQLIHSSQNRQNPMQLTPLVEIPQAQNDRQPSLSPNIEPNQQSGFQGMRPIATVTSEPDQKLLFKQSQFQDNSQTGDSQMTGFRPIAVSPPQSIPTTTITEHTQSTGAVSSADSLASSTPGPTSSDANSPAPDVSPRPPIRFSQALPNDTDKEEEPADGGTGQVLASGSVAASQSSSSEITTPNTITTTTASVVTTASPPISSTETTPSTTTTTQSPSTASTELTSTTETTSGEETSDPFGFFRVSECNIYGRVYKVGQPIDELSAECKRCTCTSQGVECKSAC